MSTKQIEYCDVVMKGGITSGIVYPNAVLALARRYTFKNIGGTSAGAIAAAACAAAALGERRKLFARSDIAGGADEVGLSGLAGVADQLKRPGFIFGLFQPARGGRAVFSLLVTLAARPGRARSVIAVLVGSLAMAPVGIALVLAALLGMAWLSA